MAPKDTNKSDKSSTSDKIKKSSKSEDNRKPDSKSNRADDVLRSTGICCREGRI